jgi:hypothetical protein
MMATIETFKSKWGHHPCDHDTCLKLKETHRLLLRAYCDVKQFIRWDNKLAHNRKGKKPRCPDLIEFGYHYRTKDRTYYGNGFTRHGQENLYLFVLQQYQNARRPKPRPEDVEPLSLPAHLDTIVEKLREFYK